jgi:predicted double-glycine peptidase
MAGFVAAHLGSLGTIVVASEPDIVTFLGPQRQFTARVETWQSTKSRNVVLQQYEYTCGAASLATILRYYYDDPISEQRILQAALGGLNDKEAKDREENGLSMEDLSRGASKLKYSAAVLKTTYGKLNKLPIPVVVRLIKDDFKHFVVYRGELDGYVFVADPIRGNVRMPRQQFLEQWDGHLLAVVKPGQKPRTDHPLQVPEDQLVTPENLAARRSLFDQTPALRPPR